MNILLVEGALNVSQSTATNLRRRGFTVTCADSLAMALVKLSAGGIDAILLDLSLPDGSGREAFLKVQRHAVGVPIVVFTVQDDSCEPIDFVIAGAQDYLVKGIARDDAVVRCLEYAVERSKGELALRKSEQRLKVILENSYDAFISMDANWRITDWNGQAEKTFGWSREEALGKLLEFIIPVRVRLQYLSEDIEEYFNQCLERSIVKTMRELVVVHRDGHEFSIEMGIFRITEDCEYKLCAFARDITERKKSNEELERLVQVRTEKLLQSNEELRQFAKIASHDLQEPLRAVQGFANLLVASSEGKLDKDCTEFVEYILDGVQRMTNLIRSILVHTQVSQDTTLNHSTNCNAVMAEVMADMQSSITETGTSFEIHKLPDVAVERSQVAQLFQNLISNSIKYRSSEPPQISMTAERNLSGWLFSVADNSIGIEPQYADKIFDMFSRLHAKTQYPGTGMGLAICKKIVTSHGGTIWVESKLGEGSIFLFTLPAIIESKENVNEHN